MKLQVNMMEELTGERIGCVEEILIRRGMVGCEDIVGVCDNDTRRYLKDLFQQKIILAIVKE